jgi:hypothetical protein
MFYFTSSDMDFSFHVIWTYKENYVDLIYIYMNDQFGALKQVHKLKKFKMLNRPMYKCVFKNTSIDLTSQF